MFFRIIGALMFSLAGGVAGVSFSERVRNELELCRSIRAMLLNTSVIIRCRASDVYTIASELKQDRSLQRLTFLQKIPEEYTPEENFREVWYEALELQKNLPEDARRILSEFGAVIGQSDIEGQLVSIDALSENASILEKKYSGIYSQKGRLYRSVGMLFGIMVGILII